MTTQTRLTHDEWLAEATSLFGEDPKKWRFVCPACGYVQSIQDFLDRTKLTKKEIGTQIGFSCIGRHDGHRNVDMGTKPGPCNYAGGGLFRLNPVIVMMDGKENDVFDFDRSKEVTL